MLSMHVEADLEAARQDLVEIRRTHGAIDAYYAALDRLTALARSAIATLGEAPTEPSPEERARVRIESRTHAYRGE